MDRESIQERFGIIGRSASLRNVIDRMRQVAKTDITVLVQGESGVGKELVAQAIHGLSSRRHEPLIIVNCGAIPEGLIESELFGAEKGAYTGSVERRTGYFEDADGGTIFLDEIGEMPQPAQVRLLRVLENGQFTRVGSSQVRYADARIIAATNKDLAQEVRTGRFREDLYYRLSTVLIDIPPLRERKEDILPLLETFLHRFAQKYNSPVKQLAEDARELVLHYHWPGNVRELRNVAEQIEVLLRGETVDAEDIRPYLRGVTARDAGTDLMPVSRDEHGDPNEARERELIYRALLELRMEVREMREEMKAMASTRGGIAVPRDLFEQEGRTSEGDYVLVRGSKRDDYAKLIEDAAYEIENDDGGPSSANASTNGGGDAPDGERRNREEDADEAASAGQEELPTIEDAEQQLIARALKQFEGNRRKTAKALGISERTLYRKLKDLEEEL
ncbi:MAG: sigma 54-interacting transcriptional regulator [Rhodothermales bacterium]